MFLLPLQQTLLTRIQPLHRWWLIVLLPQVVKRELLRRSSTVLGGLLELVHFCGHGFGVRTRVKQIAIFETLFGPHPLHVAELDLSTLRVHAANGLIHAADDVAVVVVVAASWSVLLHFNLAIHFLNLPPGLLLRFAVLLL